MARSSRNSKRVPEVFQSIADVAAKFLLDKQFATQETSTRLAEELALLICAQFRGELVYLPTCAQLVAVNQHSAMYNEFRDGQTHLQIAVKYGLTLQHVYDVISDQRKSWIEQHQTTLFDVFDEDNQP